MRKTSGFIYSAEHRANISAALRKPGNALRRARLRAGLTPQQLAARVFVGPCTVAHWETGLRIPPPRKAKRLVRALPGLTLDAIYADL